MVRPSLATSHPSEALLLKGAVADGEHFVDDQDLRLEVRGDGEGQPHIHAAGVALDRRIDEFFDPGKSRRSRRTCASISRAAHAEDRAVQIDVFAAGQLGVKAGADFQQAGHAALDQRAAFGRLGDPREDLEQRRFAGAVASDDADDLAVAESRNSRRAAPRFPRGCRLRP